jgi:transposase
MAPGPVDGHEGGRLDHPSGLRDLLGARVASSGDQVRHRLSRIGNRQINRVLHIMATVQLRNPTEGRAYYDRRKDDGKTSME